MATFTNRLVKKARFKSASLIGLARYNCRFCLDLEFTLNNNKTAVAILMNPSSTGRQNIFYGVNLKEVTDVDDTTRNVIRVLVKNGANIKNQLIANYNHLVILNLFPYYSSKPNEIYKIYKNNTEPTYQINLAIINSIFCKYPNADYFLGWISDNKLTYAETDLKNLLSLFNIKPYYFDKANNQFDFYQFNGQLIMCHAKNWK